MSSMSSKSQGSHSSGTSHHKFSSIVNKVESLINKMNNDKFNNFKLLQSNAALPGQNLAAPKQTHSVRDNAPLSYQIEERDLQSCVQCTSEQQGLESLEHILTRTASLDSLNQLTDAEDVFDNHDLVYTDSDDAEIAHITGTTAVQVHRRSDLDQLTDETIREFNEQCSSLSHDADFDNAWSAEEDEHRCWTAVGVEADCCCDSDRQEDTGQDFGQMYKYEMFKSHNSNNNNSNNDSNNSKINEYAKYQRDKNNNSNDEKELVQKGNPLETIWGSIQKKQQQSDDGNENYFAKEDNANEAVADRDEEIEMREKEQHSTSGYENASIINTDANTSSNNNNENSGNTNDNQQQGSNKPRRPSLASSGSVGRMETILEEPGECKVSVKEILARFETMSLTESQSKASTLSSGARAAAQTLNVPIERLESRQSNHREHGNAVNSHNGMAAMNSSSGHETLLEKSVGLQHGRHSADTEVDVHHDSQHLLDSEADSMIPNASTHMEAQKERHQYTKQASYLHSARKTSSSQQQQPQQPQPQPQQQHQQMLAHNHAPMPHHLDANYMTEEPNGSGGPSPSVTKYSLLQFAMQHFRNDQYPEVRAHTRDPTRDHGDGRIPSYADLVKWQGIPIRMPLLRLPNDLAPLALECFECILRYCGDIPHDPELTEVKCVYTVLMHCHKYLALRDEVYCQLMKQTTANRSPCPDSAQRAWRLLSILAAYFGCSDALRPYLMEHLTSAASDRRRSCHGTAAVCLANLRKTARCGGRKNVPSVEEVTAVSAGRSARRQIYRLPGGAERVVNTRCSTVVADVIAELCALLSVESEAEQQEFSLYCIVQGDAFTMPLAADEYILDVTTELLKSGQPFYLIFCRSVWHFPLKRDPAPTPLYVEVLFNQVAPDYLEGLLLEIPSNGVPIPEIVRDMARIAALLHRAADLTHVPAMKEIKFLLPKPALGIREIRPAQWVGLVQSAWPQIAGLMPGQVKAQFLTVLSAWPLFGSSFFAVKRIWAEEGPHVEDTNPMWRDLILALNRRGVLFLDPNTHETLQHWPFMEVISTRKVRSEDGALFLDMKVGNLMQQRVIRVQTEQAHEISRLVRQYITMAQISQRDKREMN